MTVDTDHWLTYLKRDSGLCKRSLLWHPGHISGPTWGEKRGNGVRLLPRVIPLERKGAIKNNETENLHTSSCSDGVVVLNTNNIGAQGVRQDGETLRCYGGRAPFVMTQMCRVRRAGTVNVRQRNRPSELMENLKS